MKQPNISPVASIQSLQPYSPGKPIEELERELGIHPIIKLASNENPLGASPLAIEAAKSALEQANRYPDGCGFILKKALCEHLKVESEMITLGNGSDSVIELVARAFVGVDDEVIFSEFAFAVYPLITQAIGAKAIVCPATDWGHDLNKMLAAITGKTKLIFIANPNNPTGTYIPDAELKEFIGKVPEHVIVVIDEAYYEYQVQEDYQTALNWLADYPNVVVTRTFSKVYGLASLRVGYGVSHPQIADYLNRIRSPFNVNTPAMAAAAAALSDDAFVQQSVEMNQAGMKQLVEAFERQQIAYIPSVGNFVCVEVGPKAAEIFSALLHKGVIVRPVANYNMPNHLRVTVGTAEENSFFLNAFEEVMGS